MPPVAAPAATTGCRRRKRSAISTVATRDSTPPRVSASAPTKTRPKNIAFSAALAPSNGRSATSDRGSAREARARFTRPIGTLIANSHSQEPMARMPAATVGAMAAASETTSALIPNAAPEQTVRPGVAHQRAVHAHDAGGADALHDACGDERRQRLRQRAGERADDEDHETRDVDAAVAEPLAERGDGQQRDDGGELVGIDDPDRRCRRRVDAMRDGGERDIRDGRVEHRHRDAEADGQHRPIAPRQGQAVWGVGHRALDPSLRAKRSNPGAAARMLKLSSPATPGLLRLRLAMTSSCKTPASGRHKATRPPARAAPRPRRSPSAPHRRRGRRPAPCRGGRRRPCRRARWRRHAPAPPHRSAE